MIYVVVRNVTDNLHYDFIKIPRILYSLSYGSVTANILHNNMINQILLSHCLSSKEVCGFV